MSQNTATLQELLHQDTEFSCNESHDAAFHCIKQLIAVDVTLHHYNVKHPVKIYVDASLHGLGAALVQDGKPVAFASKALTCTEQQYANIEHELLAIVFGVEQFDSYVFEHTFTVHKSLEQIQWKTMADEPVYLQWMLLHLQEYDCMIVYHPEKEMLLADTLSRYVPLTSNEIMPNTRNASHQKLSRTDPLLRSLAEMIIDGWSEDPKDVPQALRPYWNHWDTITVEDGIILYGETILIPSVEREEVL